MNLYHLVTGKLPVNTYILENKGKAVVIDGGTHPDTILAFAREHKFRVKYMLLTHTHFDHALCSKYMQDSGVKVGVCLYEEEGLYTDEVNLTGKFLYTFPKTKADFTFIGDEYLHLCEMDIKVILTKGHSKGSCCFFIDNKLFSGDTLLLDCIGRTDMFGASKKDMKKSLNKLMELDDSVIVYPGHGESTTIEHERKYNPFIRL